MSEQAAATPLAVRAVALSALSDGQGFLRLYWRATLVLVRVQVAWRTCDRALRILNEVWPDILGSLDNELVVYASEVRADTLVSLVNEVIKERQSAGEDGIKALHEAVDLYTKAAELHDELGSPPKRIEILKKLAHLHHRLEDLASRDRVSKVCREASTHWQARKKDIHQDQMTKFSCVQTICAFASAIIAA